MNSSSELDQLKLKKEETYFIIVAIIAGLCWLLVAVTVIGIFYGILIGLSLWLANGLIIARLKSESVLVTEQQMPLLHRTFLEVVAMLELKETPPLYIVQAHGILNAFATRWSGRHFVVIHSDMLEACGEDTAQIRFLIGHELGHIRSNHLLKKVFLAPGLLFPLIGSAYSRACEGTCDRYGGYASGNLRAAAQAMLILAGGKRAWVGMDPEVFSEQYTLERGFFVSWHELTSGYPTLSQRTHNLLTMDVSAQPVGEPRHPLAYLFALFSLGGQQGTGGNMLVTVAVVAMLFAIVMPAVKQAQMRALQARQVSAFGTTSNTPAGAMELPQMESLTLSSSVDPIGNPTDSLDEISANLQMVYACSRWRIAPGPHQLALILSDGAGKPLTDAKYKFVARETEWRTWHRMNLGGINPRPAEFIVTVYLDGKEMGTRRVAGGTQ